MSNKSTSQIPLFNKIGYSMGNFSYGLISQTIATYIVFFGTNILGVSGTLITTAVSLSVIWDAVTDPVMGYISDMTDHKRFGRRHLYILIGVIFMSLFNLFLWRVSPSWSHFYTFLMVISFLILTKTFLTIYTTPFTALGAELSNDYNERTSIQGIRTIFFLLGIVTATVMGLLLFFNPTPEFPIGQDNPAAYGNMGISASIAALLFGLICFFSTYKYIPILKKSTIDKSVHHGIKNISRSFLNSLKNRQFRYVVFAYLFTNIASGIFTTIGLHV